MPGAKKITYMADKAYISQGCCYYWEDIPLLPYTQSKWLDMWCRILTHEMVGTETDKCSSFIFPYT